MKPLLTTIPIFTALLTCFFWGDLVAQEYPMIRVVNMETDVYSGPGANYYVTSRVKSGDRVEIYYESNGWCAIRPPIGSFSWVGGQYVQLGADQIGTVISDGLVSRIGSESELDAVNQGATVQIKLKRGENILVLDRMETPENPASPVWYKIAPPPGEFRWIHRSAFDATIAVKPQRTNGTIRQVAAIDEVPSRYVHAMLPVRLTAPHRENDAESGTTLRPTETVLTGRSIPLDDIDPYEEAARFLAEDVKKELAQLEKETRDAMLSRADVAVFDELIRRAEHLYGVIPNPDDLGTLFQLSELLKRTRIVRQELIARQQIKSMSSLPPPLTVQPVPQNNLVFPPTPTPTKRGSANGGNTAVAQTRLQSRAAFDVSGRLRQFSPIPPGHPPYALVDDANKVICLVSQGNGVDLRKFVGQLVGINGMVGVYKLDGNPDKRQITAQAVFPIAQK